MSTSNPESGSILPFSDTSPRRATGYLAAFLVASFAYGHAEYRKATIANQARLPQTAVETTPPSIVRSLEQQALIKIRSSNSQVIDRMNLARRTSFFVMTASIVGGIFELVFPLSEED